MNFKIFKSDLYSTPQKEFITAIIKIDSRDIFS